mmetsp:Transcript_13454/g.20374  ORF Transcript_13454/g.20374 Transcript_13454/m.20374 type:complete len:684 (+) Transcript_13454:42-2093(+)
MDMDSPPPTPSQEVFHVKSQECYDKAVKCIRQGNYTQALIYTNRCIFLTPEDPRFYNFRANIFLEIGDIKSSMLNYKYAVTLSPKSTEYRKKLGNLLDLQGNTLMDIGKYEEALINFNSAYMYNPSTTYLIHRAIAHSKLSKSTSARDHDQHMVRALKDLYEADKLKPIVNIVRGTIFMEKLNDLMAARNELHIILQYEKDEDHVLYKTIIQKYKTLFKKHILEKKENVKHIVSNENYAEAVQVLHELIEILPTDISLYMMRATCYKKLETLQPAAKDLFKVIHLSKETNDEAVLELSETLYFIGLKHYRKSHGVFNASAQQKLYREAINYFDEAIKWNSSNDAFYQSRGEVKASMTNYQEAIDDFECIQNVTLKFSKLSSLHNEWGIILFSARKYERAEDELSKAIAYDKFNGTYYYNRAKIRLQLRNTISAIEDILVAWSIDPSNEELTLKVQQLAPKLMNDKKMLKQLYQKYNLLEDKPQTLMPHSFRAPTPNVTDLPPPQKKVIVPHPTTPRTPKRPRAKSAVRRRRRKSTPVSTHSETTSPRSIVIPSSPVSLPANSPIRRERLASFGSKTFSFRPQSSYSRPLNYFDNDPHSFSQSKEELDFENYRRKTQKAAFDSNMSKLRQKCIPPPDAIDRTGGVYKKEKGTRWRTIKKYEKKRSDRMVANAKRRASLAVSKRS